MAALDDQFLQIHGTTKQRVCEFGFVVLPSIATKVHYDRYMYHKHIV